MAEFQKQFEIARWIAEDLAGVLSEENRHSLQEWLNASVRHVALYNEIRKDFSQGRHAVLYTRKEIDAQLDKFYRRNYWKQRCRKWGVRWIGYAAAVVLVVGIVFCVNRQGKQLWEPLPVVPATGITIPKANVQLVLSSGEEISMSDQEKLVPQDGNVRIEKLANGLSYKRQGFDSGNEVRYNTLIVPKGGDFKLCLSDGTVIWLNSCTQLRYPTAFSGKLREVFLEGEAYFEVAKNAEMPFFVRTDNVDVKVLGTSFNVSAYKDDKNVTTTLAQGSVEVLMPQGNRVIRPNEQLIFNRQNGCFDCRKVDASMYSAWKDGMFVFEDETLEHIMDRLRIWYDVEVFYASDEVREYRFSGDLKRYDDFSRIVRMLEEVAGVSIQISGNNIVIGTK